MSVPGPRMDILFIVRAYIKAGGISRYVVELAEAAVRRGHAVSALVASADIRPAPGITLAWVRSSSLAALRRRGFHALNTLIEVLGFAVRSAGVSGVAAHGVVHSQGDYPRSSDVYTAHSCHKAWLRLFRASHPGALGWLMKSPLNPLHALLLVLEWISVRRTRRIIAISQGIRAELAACYPGCERKVTVIPHGVNLSDFNPVHAPRARLRVRNLYGIWPDDLVIVFPAHEFRRKGLIPLIEAVASLRDPKIKVLVVGRDRHQPYADHAADLGCAAQILFAGATTRIADFFYAADLMVFPTVYEPFGLVILEAMACSLPVVVSRSAGAAELITHGVDGMLLDDPRSVTAAADAIAHLRTDAGLRARMGTAARATAERYTWDAIAERTFAVYRDVLAEKGV